MCATTVTPLLAKALRCCSPETKVLDLFSERTTAKSNSCDETAALWYQDHFAVEFRLMFFEQLMGHGGFGKRHNPVHVSL